MDSTIRQGYSGKLYKSIFFNMLLSSILHGWILCIGSVVDSLFAGKFLGSEGIAAVGFFAPMQVFIWLLINIISNGGNVVIGHIIGRGEFDDADRIFSFCCIIMIVVSIFITAATLIFHNPLCIFLGAKDRALQLTAEYVKGFAIGFPAMMLSGFLTSVMAYSHNQKRTALITAILYVVNDTVFNFVFIKIFDMGMFGLGLATSVSNCIVDIFLLSQYWFHKSMLSFRFRHIPYHYIGKILKVGIPAASIEIYIVIRVFAYNKLLLLTGGVTAVSAYAVTCLIESFMNAVSNGISGSVLSVGSIIIGEQDKEALKSFSAVLYKYGMIIICSAAAILFVIADFVCIPFVGSDPQALRLSAEAVRFLAVSYLFSLLFNINMRFYQVQEYNVFVSIIYVFSNLVFPVGSALLLTQLMSVRGVWVSLVLKDLLSLILIWCCASIMSKHPFMRITDFITLGRQPVTDPDQQITLTVTSKEEVLNLVAYILDFGKSHGMTDKTASFTAMAIEEIAMNVVTHGFSADNKQHSIDIKITRHSETVVVSVKDNCKPFNPQEFYNACYKHSDPTKNIGIKLIFGICRDIQYKSMFGLNVLMFKIGVQS